MNNTKHDEQAWEGSSLSAEGKLALAVAEIHRLRALLATEREKTDQSVPMKSILAARDLFDIGTPEYEAIDDIIAGKWGIGR